MKKALLLPCFLTIVTLEAQNIQPSLDISYPMNGKNTPVSMEMFNHYAYWSSDNCIFNLKEGNVCKTKGTIMTFKVSPSGDRIAMIYRKGGKNTLTVQDLWDSENVKIKQIPKLKHPTAIAYTPDGKQLVVADADGSINFFNSTTFSKNLSLHCESQIGQIQISKNGAYIAAISDEGSLNIWSIPSKNLLKVIPLYNGVSAVKFSDDSSQIAVLTDDGILLMYDTQNFFPTGEFDTMVSSSKDFALHKDGKYIAIAQNDKVALINTYDNHDREYFTASGGGVTDIYFIKDSNSDERLVFNSSNEIRYTSIKEHILPNYSMLMADELSQKMDVWMNRMPDESLEAYNMRVNEETIPLQKRLFEEEIATRMAENLLEDSEITFGSFNPESNILAVNFNTMPPAFLPVPSEDVGYFMNPENLEYRDAIYALDKNDRFELVYLNVYNNKTCQTYTFDNRERKDLEYMLSEDGFVPVEIVAMSNMEEVTLQGIKENIMEAAMQQNLISSHTVIDVTTGVSTETDPDGSRNVNYNIGFTYNVEAAYSAQEDFTPGEYHVDKSGAAKSMCEIIRTAFETEFADYIKAGKKLRIKITGMADSLPINGVIPYDGCYGDFSSYPVIGKGFDSVSISKESGITENPQLAFLRAVGVKDSIENSIPGINLMDTEYIYDIQIADQAGGAFRRISVDFVFINAF